MIEEYYDLFLPEGLSNSLSQDDLSSLLSCEDSLFYSCMICALLPVVLYYAFYTKGCFWGYHYRVKHWGGWMVVFILIMTMIAWLWPLQELDNNLSIDYGEIERIEWRLYWANVAIFVSTYLVGSWLWCQFLPTNAYRFLKIGH